MLSGQASDVHYPPEEDYYIITCSPVLLSRHGCSVLYLFASLSDFVSSISFLAFSDFLFRT